MKLVLIPAGDFMMGSPDSDWSGDVQKSEKPQHWVGIVEPFYLGICEVTQEQYLREMGKNPSRFMGNPQRPVETVSWNDAMKFCRRLSKKEGVTYRLPTEAEWEYACRGGTTTRFSFGDDRDDLGDYAWWGGNSQATTHPVGQKRPNAWGLYDMHGNVFEWCADWYADDYYSRSFIVDPSGPGSGQLRLLRGGSWCGAMPGYFFRSAGRYFKGPGCRFDNIGFRVARTRDKPPIPSRR
jgi:formylglycine-generating enzyme required for sulfatase activity